MISVSVSSLGHLFQIRPEPPKATVFLALGNVINGEYPRIVGAPESEAQVEAFSQEIPAGLG